MRNLAERFSGVEDAVLPFILLSFCKAYSRRSRRVIWCTAVFLFVRA